MRVLAGVPISAPLLVLAIASPPARAQTPAQAPDTMTATVERVDLPDSTVHMVYGYSLALKVAAMAVAPDCRILVNGSPAPLSAIRPGQVVRVRYRRAQAAAMVAQTIEVVRRSETEP
jgi:hypothetical protein